MLGVSASNSAASFLTPLVHDRWVATAPQTKPNANIETNNANATIFCPPTPEASVLWYGHAATIYWDREFYPNIPYTAPLVGAAHEL